MGGRESDYSVCPRLLLQVLQCFQFMSDRLRQVSPGYISLSQFTSEGRDVELDNLRKTMKNSVKNDIFLGFSTHFLPIF